MKLSIAVPIYGQLEDTKGVWGTLIASVARKEQVQLVVVNNLPSDPSSAFLERFVFPYFPDHVLIENAENAGVIHSLNQCLVAATGDVIALLHNDLYVYDYGWNERVVRLFTEHERAGLAGFFGARGIAANGGRIHSMSNLLEAEIHGDRNSGERRVAGFDGLALIGRRAMFDQVGGFDEGHAYHHLYDRSISLESHFAGWENWFIGVSCHHRSGVTANRPDYQAWIAQKMGTEVGKGDIASYQKSEQYFLQKWGARLPLMIP